MNKVISLIFGLILLTSTAVYTFGSAGLGNATAFSGAPSFLVPVLTIGSAIAVVYAFLPKGKK